MKLKIALIASLTFATAHALAANVPVASQSGTITLKGNIYTSGCTIEPSAGSSTTMKIPTTYASDYAKGDMSPLSTPSTTSGTVQFSCPTTAGVMFRVDGVADTADPALFQVTPGTGKAAGVALKIIASSGQSGSSVKDIVMVPNQLNSQVFPTLSGTSKTIAATFKTQAVAVADKVTAGDLSTTLTWTAIYN